MDDEFESRRGLTGAVLGLLIMLALVVLVLVVVNAFRIWGQS